jgi:hypothetical protein
MRVVLLLGLGGCAATTSVPVGTLSDDPELLSTQTLKPKVLREACGWSLPFRSTTYDGLVTRALAQVPDATVLRNAAVETRSLHALVAVRTCATVRGDATRRISEVVLPDVSGTHGGHH